MNKTKELILYKESALIQSEWTFSLLQRKFYDVIIYLARKQYFYKDYEYWNNAGYDGMDKNNNSINYAYFRKNKFRINKKELFALASEKEINEKDAEVLIYELYKKEIKYNILGKDKSGVWEKGTGYTHAIPEMKFFKDYIEISLPEPIYDVLSQEIKPLSFAKLDILILRRFKSKFAIIIYEILSDYTNSPQIPKIPIDNLKKLFGVGKDYTITNLKKRCLDPAVAEINQIPNIDFTASYDIIRRRQTPLEIQFKTEKNQEIVIDNEPTQNQEVMGKKADIPPERVKEILKKLDISKLPAEKKEELFKRYKYAITEANNV
ncbi:MAG: replication initiation protein [Deltaproteobacteria bacterium]|nr:replication initiation protein [Deltaproteobacteria bacterium]